MSKQEDLSSLKKRIRELENELSAIKNLPQSPPEGPTVKVPDNVKPIFDQAQKTVGEYFSQLKFNPGHGSIQIHEQRYVLVRASALSYDFLNTIQQLYADRGKKEAMSIGKNFLFDIAHVIGTNDAKKFHEEMDLTDPIAKLAAGPVHFAYTGWAFVDILPESNPSPDENYYLIYHHPYSFEADSWIRAGHKSDTPVCIMNAGYSSGWCEESFGIPLTAVEVTCKAKGDEHCTFIMSPPHKIEEHLKKYSARHDKLKPSKQAYDIPTFFERKKVEEQLALHALIIESTDEAIFSTTPDGIITSWNRGAEKLFGYSRKKVVGQPFTILVPKERETERRELTEQVKAGESVHHFETIWQKKNHEQFDISLTMSPVKDAKNHLVGFSVIVRDISKRKQAESALLQLNNSLELLVQDRTSDLQRAYDELETRVTFRNLDLEKKNKANLEKIDALEKQVAALTKKP